MHYSCLIAKLNPRIPKRNRENEIEKRESKSEKESRIADSITFSIFMKYLINGLRNDMQ